MKKHNNKSGKKHTKKIKISIFSVLTNFRAIILKPSCAHKSPGVLLKGRFWSRWPGWGLDSVFLTGTQEILTLLVPDLHLIGKDLAPTFPNIHSDSRSFLWYLAPLLFLDEMSAAFSALPYKASPHGGTKSMSSTEEQAEVVQASASMHPPWLQSLCKLEVHPTETILTSEGAPVAIP